MTATSAPPAAAARPQVPRAVPVAISAAWLAALAVTVSGQGRWLGHDASFTLGLPLPVAYLLFAASWTLMLVAMMLPTMLPLLRLFRRLSAGQPRPDRAFAAFLAGYGVLWVAFGFLALTGDVALHLVVEAVPAFDQAVIGAGLLGAAGLFQFTRLKERCLTECRNPGAYVLPRYRHGARAAFELARGHARYCLGCCWALMLVMFAVGVTGLWLMAPLGALMVYEKAGRHGRVAARIGGVVLVAWGILVLMAPGLLPAPLDLGASL